MNKRDPKTFHKKPHLKRTHRGGIFEMPVAKCLIEKCGGWETTTGSPNLIQHIKSVAKAELLNRHIMGSGDIPHADWIKDNVKATLIQRQQITIKLNGQIHVFGKEWIK